MSSQHYFSASPEGPFTRRSVEVTLDGRSVSVSTAGGIFSPEGVDKGTAVLLKHAPAPAQHGDLLDIGCGWGPIALVMAMRSPEATVWAVDVNERSRTLCAENAAALGLTNVRVSAPEDVPTDLSFASIWSNPPIRVGKEALHGLLQHWLPRLSPGGEAWLVVQKNLGADSLLTWMTTMLTEAEGQFRSDRAETSKGFRLLRVQRV
ncbi:class I SAM-dependent methyltransferase [Nesterenkonia lutea]|uniref:16S rRNA G1207 methylase RsmC n=1 Tax=Nesterenkonia lutea TaxID=272919 RepID=A0ABR9JEG2_9MICC|nr:methyltransferase [Nesterenkonia lutea]MBE1524311.1 16S rRNA G1207 methylase RsmC [Nesterenkonia lutea]